MSVDVLTDVVIDRPRHEVAAYAGDPTNAPEWYVNIESVEWKTPAPIRIGSRIAFVAHFRGTPSGFSTLVAPLMTSAMRRANRKDLLALKARLEADGRTAHR